MNHSAPITKTTPLPLTRAAVVLAGVVVVFTVPLALAGVASASTVTATLSNGPYDNGHTVSISVPANSLFTPGAGVNVLECADPGGSTDSLPVNDLSCDGNTVQGNTIIVGAKGQISETGYLIYRLPNTVLGEPSDTLPKCDPTHACVLYIGQEQNSFSKPHIFSSPFYVDGAWSPPSTSSGVPVVVPIALVAVVVIVAAALLVARNRKKVVVES